jgi:uncharacterized SAM-binding protein YcdF (DUF218 family)
MGGWHRLARLISRPLQVREAAGVGEGSVAPARAIVVLGAALDARSELTEVGQERVRAAAALWRRGGAPLVIPSGGVTRGEVRSEAAAMADELVAQGVPRAAILVEDRARSTAENARYCAQLLREGGAAANPRASAAGASGGVRDASEGPGSALGAVWLVTQPFHGRRAKLCFRRVGFEARVWFIADSIELSDPRRALRWSLREYLAWAKALVVR